jgi:hypothetical protein
MNANDTARRITARFFPTSDAARAVRLERFLNDPRAQGTPEHRRVLELLSIARARKEFVEANLPAWTHRR